MIHDRVLITLSCGHQTMGERICSTCVEYYENVPCDACADRVVPDPPTECECSPLREPEEWETKR